MSGGDELADTSQAPEKQATVDMSVDVKFEGGLVEGGETWFEAQLIHVEGHAHDGVRVDHHDEILLGLGLVQPVPHRHRLVDAAAARMHASPPRCQAQILPRGGNEHDVGLQAFL